MKIDKTKLSMTEAVVVELEDFSDLVVHDEVEIVCYNGKPAFFLGEFDMWYWIAPLHTLKAVKCCEDDYERDYEIYMTKFELMELMK